MNHHRLDCYKLLLDVAKRMPGLVVRLPKGTAYLEDQLKRALSSAILNLTEGNGRRSLKERRRFFDISLGSISEVASIIDIMTAYHYLSETESEDLKSQLRHSFAMIIKLKSYHPKF
jgi:four helix bundle protein